MDVGNGRGFPRANRDATILNRIMLKFRPIAPKPVAAGSASASAQEDNKTDDVTKRRSKRKYVRVKKKVSRCYSSRNNNNNPGEEEEEEERRNPSRLDTSLLTLQLLPESSGSSTSTAVDSPKKGSFEKMLNFSSAQERPLWMMNNNNFDNHRNNDIAAVLWADQRMGLRVVESWVMVEGLSKIWVDEDGGGIGDTDMEKMKNLEVDTCPGLISEGLDRVQWVNLAYRRMVDPLHGGGGPPAEVVARLVVKDKIRTALPAAFACTVRVMYTRHTGKHTQQTMPCDVWKMEFGGFAWRFDAQAALCLGR